MVPPPGQGPTTTGPATTARTIGRYVVLEELARGGMGVVLVGWDPQLRVKRAIKVLLGTGSEPDDLLRFEREARVLARLRHPNIVQVLEAGTDQGKPYLVLPLVEGGSLAALVRKGPLEVGRALDIMDRVAQAIHCAHGNGVVHRDLKPANILLDPDGTPYVTDFGIARELETRDALTKTGQLMGTPAYMPPEQAQGGAAAVGPRADVYALGAILWELLVGRPPYEGQPMAILQEILRGPPPPLRSLRPDVSRDVAAIVAVAMASAPGDRYDGAAALAADVRRAIEGRPVLARPMGPFGKTARWVARRPARASALGVAATAILAGGVVEVGRLREQQAEGLRRQSAELVGQAWTMAPGEGLERLRRAVELDPHAPSAQRALAQAALDAGELPTATAAIAACERLGQDDPEFRLLAARVALRHPSPDRRLARSALETCWAAGRRGDDVAPLLVRLLLDEGAPDEALARLADIGEARCRGSTALLDLRIEARAALGGASAAESDRWRAFTLDPTTTAPLEGIVVGLLEVDDAPALTLLWQDVFRALDGHALVDLLEGERARLIDDADAGAPPARRLCAALAGAVFRSGSYRQRVEPLLEDPAPIVAEAAWSSLWVAGRVDTTSLHRRVLEAREGPAAIGAALTLMEWGPRLTPGDAPFLATLRGSPSPIVRAAAALAITSGVQTDGLSFDEGRRLIEALGAAESKRPGGGSPLVRRRAEVCVRALDLLASGPPDRGAPDPDAVRLAARLEGWTLLPWPDEAVAAHIEQALDSLAGTPDTPASARALRAARALERREPVPMADVLGALSDPLGVAVALQAGPEVRSSPAVGEAMTRLRRIDPERAASLEAMASFGLETRTCALPGPGGRWRLVHRIVDADTLGAGYRLHCASLSPPDYGPLGVTTQQSTALVTRFPIDDVARMALDLEYSPEQAQADAVGLRVDVLDGSELGRLFEVGTVLTSPGAPCLRLEGRDVTASRRVIPRIDRSGGVPLVGAGLLLDRRTSSSAFRRDGEPWSVGATAPTSARRRRGAGWCSAEWWGTGHTTVRRLTLVGRPRALLLGRKAARSSATIALADGFQFLPERGGITSALSRDWLPPMTYGDIRRLGVALPVQGNWVSTDDRGYRLVASGLSGDLRLRVRAHIPQEVWARRLNYTVGVGLRGRAQLDERAFLAASALDGGSCVVALQRGPFWETYRGGLRLGTPDPLLELERVGDQLRCSVDGAPIGEPFPFPVDDPVDLMLLTREAHETPAPGLPPARFDELEVLLAPRR